MAMFQQVHTFIKNTSMTRLEVRGKFLYAGDEKFFIRGVTYGSFRPNPRIESSAGSSNDYPDPETVDVDFAAMAANGINAVRTYTVPPHWLLDLAQKYQIRVMIGLPGDQYTTFLDDKALIRATEERVRAGVRSCAGHPAILCYTIGNEIPATIARWHGQRRIERYLKRLYRLVKSEDPESLVTYVNFPSTEYLQLPFLDFYCFNVYLESQERLEAYLARLHNLAGDRPVLLAEIGLDSLRNGSEAQASILAWQIRTVFQAGCAGTFVFAWTDEWYRSGYDIEDWDFGLTTRDRWPKPALAAVRHAFTQVPFPNCTPWPRVSVVVCSYNGSCTIQDTLEGLLDLDYPNYEVIVVDDGSTDELATIASEYCTSEQFRLIKTLNKGLSNARNVGLNAATGEIVAYIDDDAYPDRHWLKYLASTFLDSNYAGIGGPNIAPAGDGPIAACVANAPGGPVHVLLTDRIAEHIPGCNMAFRKQCLLAIGGFDPRFRAAGDDVDICWRLQAQGWQLGFNPAAVVWHHRRNSIRAYWRQQQGYGKAEALLAAKWPEKYNRFGHISWGGRLYGHGLTRALDAGRGQIYHGSQGSGLFQSLYQPAPGLLSSLPLMPEWYLLLALLAAFSILSLFWTPLLVALPLLLAASATVIAQAVLSSAAARFSAPGRLKLYSLTACLHLLQPVARLKGRLEHGLTPWRRPRLTGRAKPWKQRVSVWSESWQPSETRLKMVESSLQHAHLPLRRGGDFDSWDLEIPGGAFAAIRLRMAIEDHTGGKQYMHFLLWPHIHSAGILVTVLGIVLTLPAALAHAWIPAMLLAGISSFACLSLLYESSAAMATLIDTINQTEQSVELLLLQEPEAGKKNRLFQLETLEENSA